jgi:hypothetical protein
MKKIFAILAVLAFFMVPAASMAMVQTTDADLAAITGAGVQLDISSLTIQMSLSSVTWGDYNTTGAIAGYTKAGFVNMEFYPFPMHIFVGGAPESGFGVMTKANDASMYSWALAIQTYMGSMNPTDLPTGAMQKNDITQFSQLGTPIVTNLTDLIVDINIGTAVTGNGTTAHPFVAGKTAIKLNFENGVAVALDAVAFDIVLDHLNGAVTDYAAINPLSSPGALGQYVEGLYNNSGRLSAAADHDYGYGIGQDAYASGAQTGHTPGYSDKVLGIVGISGVNMVIAPFTVMISAH